MSKSKDIGQLSTTTSTFKWEIHNFCTSCKNIGDSLCSPVFQTSYANKIAKWQLELYPKGKIEQHKNYVSLFIRYYGEDEINSTVTFSLVDNQNIKIKSNIMSNKLFNNGKSWGYDSFVQQKFVMSDNNGVLNNGVLNIFCELTFDVQMPFSQSEEDDSDDSEDDIPNYRKELDDFEKLLETEHLSDVKFVVGENTIHLHKAILASRSAVFHAMFQHDMKEKTESIVKITDVKNEVMREVLRYIYASKVNDMDKYSNDILLVAEKYSISGLKEMCEKYICSRITNQNALEYLALANTCNATRLKAKVIDFIALYPHIVNKSEFKLLDPDLMCKVIRAIVEKNSHS